jgi:hypothetical protein
MPARRFARYPGEKASERRTVAHMGLAHAFDFDGVLAGFGQLARIGPALHLRASFLQPIEHGGRAVGRVGDHCLATEFLERAGKFFRIAQPDSIAKMLQQPGRALARIRS